MKDEERNVGRLGIEEKKWTGWGKRGVAERIPARRFFYVPEFRCNPEQSVLESRYAQNRDSLIKKGCLP